MDSLGWALFPCCISKTKNWPPPLPHWALSRDHSTLRRCMCTVLRTSRPCIWSSQRHRVMGGWSHYCTDYTPGSSATSCRNCGSFCGSHIRFISHLRPHRTAVEGNLRENEFLSSCVWVILLWHCTCVMNTTFHSPSKRGNILSTESKLLETVS